MNSGTVRGNQSAFTLVEMLVSLAVLSVFMLGLSQFYTVYVRASSQARATNAINQNLSLAMHQIVQHLETAGRNEALRGVDPFEFVGVDGSPAGYHNDGMAPHASVADTVTDRSDGLHFHGFEPYSELAEDTMTDRTYVALAVNGKTSGNIASHLKDRFGIIIRKKFDETQMGTIPRFPPGTDQLSPKLDLYDSPNLQRTNILAENIDYLSFRYYDPVSDTWKDEWNTVDDDKFPKDEERIPSAVKVAIRGYDERANNGVLAERTAPPQWSEVTVSLKDGGF